VAFPFQVFRSKFWKLFYVPSMRAIRPAHIILSLTL
jgi:hypothetical protein